MKQVLLEIGRLAALQIELEAGLDDRVTKETTAAAFGDVTIEDGLRRLLRNQNFAFVYTQDALTEVRIYGEGTGGFRIITAPKQASPRHSSGSHAGIQRRPGSPHDVSRRSESGPGDIFERLAASGDHEGLLRAALEALDRERDPELLEAALDALNGLDEVPVDPLLRFAAANRNPDLTIQALQLLVEHGEGNSAVTRFLTNLARTSPSPQVREEAQSLLSESNRAPAPPEIPRAPRQSPRAAH